MPGVRRGGYRMRVQAVSAAGEEVLALGFRFSRGASRHCNFPFPGNETEAEQVT